MHLYFSIVYALSAVCVECLLKLKLVKNRLRNQSSQTTLESLLMIATESAKDGFDDIVLESFVDELKIKHPKMIIKLKTFISRVNQPRHTGF